MYLVGVEDLTMAQASESVGVEGAESLGASIHSEEPGQSADRSGRSDWTEAEFVKDEEYFHTVIGLPNVGKSPKELTVEDVPADKLEEHFGIKKGKNGYKSENIKGIPAEDIHTLVLALDGMEKFQPFTLEVARGSYYERILKRKVNWALCAHEKHRGQLRRQKILRKDCDPAQHPWKRIDHKYRPPVGLSFEPSDSKLTTGSDDMDATDMDATPSDTQPSSERTPGTCKDSVAGLKASSISCTSFLLVDPSSEALEPSTENVFASSSPLDPSIETAVATEKNLVWRSMQDIVEEEQSKYNADLFAETSTLARLKESLEDFVREIILVEEKRSQILSERSHSSASAERLKASLIAQVDVKKQLSEDLSLFDEPHDESDDGEEELENLRQKFVASCSECNILQESLTAALDKERDASSNLEELSAELSKLTEEARLVKQSITSIEGKVQHLSSACNALTYESYRLKESIRRGVAYVKPITIMCPLQSEDAFHSISECPVCSLGFHCSNWVPSPCGHTYHPSCLFPLLQYDMTTAPRCVACSQVFHPGWLMSWGFCQLECHPEVLQLADEWDLKAQAQSFKRSFLDVYKKNPLGLKERREKQEARQKKVTKSFSKESVEKSTRYQDAVASADIVEKEVRKVTKATEVDLTLSDDDDTPVKKSHWNGKLAKVKIEKDQTSSKRRISNGGPASVVVDVSDSEPNSDIPSKKVRKNSTASSQVESRRLRGTPGPLSPGLGLDANHGATDKILLKSISSVKSPPSKGAGRSGGRSAGRSAGRAGGRGRGGGKKLDY